MMSNQVEECGVRQTDRSTRSSSKSYALNIEKALTFKLNSCQNSPSISINSANNGQCLSIQFQNTIQYEAFRRAAALFYANHQIDHRCDKQGACVDILITTPTITIHLYNTKNKILIQGKNSAVEKWSNDDFDTLLVSVPQMRTKQKSTVPLGLCPSDTVPFNTNIVPLKQEMVDSDTDVSDVSDLSLCDTQEGNSDIDASDLSQSNSQRVIDFQHQLEASIELPVSDGNTCTEDLGAVMQDENDPVDVPPISSLTIVEDDVPTIQSRPLLKIVYQLYNP
jgi:hypothetical protein